jgi:hypothetical protein
MVLHIQEVLLVLTERSNSCFGVLAFWPNLTDVVDGWICLGLRKVPCARLEDAHEYWEPRHLRIGLAGVRKQRAGQSNTSNLLGFACIYVSVLKLF